MRKETITDSPGPAFRIPAGRIKALTRVIMWGVPAIILGISASAIFAGLTFRSSSSASLLVQGSLAVAASPLALCAIYMALRATRLLLLCLWPSWVGFKADAETIEVSLGPWGTRRYDTARLTIKYLFELSTDTDEAPFEALLPEEVQRDSFLPMIDHPNAAEPIDRTIERHAEGPTAQIAKQMRPLIDHWRRANGTDDSQPEDQA